MRKMLEKTLEEKKNDTLLKTKVKPNSQNFKIDEINPWRNQLKIKVTSKPEKGKANQELLNELKTILNKKIKITAGKKSREKKLLIENITPEEVIQKLNLKEPTKNKE